MGGGALEILKAASAEEAECDKPGWDIGYYDDLDDSSVPAGMIAVVDEVLQNDEWCGEATGEPWFVRFTTDRYDCVDVGYVIELGQYMLEYPDVVWYIEFEVTADFDYTFSTCEV